MSEKPPSAPKSRRDPITGVRTIIAEDRSRRPQDDGSQASIDTCPFCYGAEQRTPKALATYPHPDIGNRWAARVVTNRYPAVDVRIGSGSDGLNDAEVITGRHEVIIESPDHIASLTEVTGEQAVLVCNIYRDRLLASAGQADLESAFVFKNYGVQAGASLRHIHSQLVGLPLIPERLRQKLDGFARHYKQHSTCICCEMITNARHDQRIVLERDGIVAMCPNASRFAYETWILPTRHASRYEAEADSSLTCLSIVLREILRRMEAVLETPAYNYVIQTAPFDSKWKDHYHWHIEITPRNTMLAGFELGSGCYINTVFPDTAANRLRNAD